MRCGFEFFLAFCVSFHFLPLEAGLQSACWWSIRSAEQSRLELSSDIPPSERKLGYLNAESRRFRRLDHEDIDLRLEFERHLTNNNNDQSFEQWMATFHRNVEVRLDRSLLPGLRSESEYTFFRRQQEAAQRFLLEMNLEHDIDPKDPFFIKKIVIGEKKALNRGRAANGRLRKIHFLYYPQQDFFFQGGTLYIARSPADIYHRRLMSYQEIRNRWNDGQHMRVGQKLWMLLNPVNRAHIVKALKSAVAQIKESLQGDKKSPSTNELMTMTQSLGHGNLADTFYKLNAEDQEFVLNRFEELSQDSARLQIFESAIRSAYLRKLQAQIDKTQYSLELNNWGLWSHTSDQVIQTRLTFDHVGFRSDFDDLVESPSVGKPSNEGGYQVELRSTSGGFFATSNRTIVLTELPFINFQVDPGIGTAFWVANFRLALNSHEGSETP